MIQSASAPASSAEFRRVARIAGLFAILVLAAARLGLGLSIVRELTELHGGSVKALSDGPGRGSSFTVWRPLLDASAAASSGLAAARDYGEVIGRP